MRKIGPLKATIASSNNKKTIRIVPFLKGEAELTGKVALTMHISKFCIGLFSRAVRGHLFRFFFYHFVVFFSSLVLDS